MKSSRSIWPLTFLTEEELTRNRRAQVGNRSKVEDNNNNDSNSSNNNNNNNKRRNGEFGTRDRVLPSSADSNDGMNRQYNFCDLDRSVSGSAPNNTKKKEKNIVINI